MTVNPCDRCHHAFQALAVAGVFDPKKLARGDDPFIVPDEDALDRLCLKCLGIMDARNERLNVRRRAARLAAKQAAKKKRKKR